MLTFRQKLSLAWRILRKDESNSLRHADAELLRAFPPDPPGITEDMPGWNDAMRLQIMEVLTVFAVQGNSGMSASVAIPAITRLMQQEPLTPLTGEDDEWNDVSEYGDGIGRTWQNRRCSHVFKEWGPTPSDPLAQRDRYYTIEGYVFEEPDGARYSNRHSRKPIAFPYTPGPATTIKVDADGVPKLKIHRELFGFPEPVKGGAPANG